MQKIQIYTIIISLISITSISLNGMHILKRTQKRLQPITYKTYSQGPFFNYYMYAKSKDETFRKISKLININPTLPQNWLQKLLGKPGNPNPEYYAILKDFEGHADFHTKPSNKELLL